MPIPGGEGGGPNPPYGEDFFARIVNVHWPKKKKVSGGVFVAADNDSNVFYIKIGPDETQDNLGKLSWVGLGTLDFMKDEGSMFAGAVNGSSFAVVNGESVFVLVGGGVHANGVGLIMASRDGLNWSRVFTYGTNSPTFIGANIFGVVWDGTQFWAGAHRSDQGSGGGIGTTAWLSETDVLLSSSDGFNWSEAGSYENRIERTVGGPEFPPWPEYKRGLLAPHCRDTVIDVYGNGLPDGFYSSDSINQTKAVPNWESMPSISYLFGGSNSGLGGPSVTVTNLELGIAETTSPGLPVTCVAGTAGQLVTGGGTYSSSGAPGTCNAALSHFGSAEAGTTIGWTRRDPPGGNAIITICGG